MGRAQRKPAAVATDPFATVLGGTRGGGTRALVPDVPPVTDAEMENLATVIGTIDLHRMEFFLQQARLLTTQPYDKTGVAARLLSPAATHEFVRQQFARRQLDSNEEAALVSVRNLFADALYGHSVLNQAAYGRAASLFVGRSEGAELLGAWQYATAVLPADQISAAQDSLIVANFDSVYSAGHVADDTGLSEVAVLHRALLLPDVQPFQWYSWTPKKVHGWMNLPPELQRGKLSPSAPFSTPDERMSFNTQLQPVELANELLQRPELLAHVREHGDPELLPFLHDLINHLEPNGLPGKYGWLLEKRP